MALTDPWSGEDDTDCDYYDTPSGNIWCPDDEPGQQAPGYEPGARVAYASSATTTRPEPDLTARTGTAAVITRHPYRSVVE